MNDKFVTNINALDRMEYENVEHRSQILQEMVLSEKNEVEPFLMDSFASFYKYNPVVKKQVPSDKVLQKRLIEKIHDLPEFEGLRDFTVGDEIFSIGAIGVARRVWEDGVPDKIKKKQKEINNIMDQRDEKQDEVVEAMVAGNAEEAEAAQGEADALDMLAAEGAADIEEMLEYAEDDIRGVARSAMAEATENANNVTSAVGALAGKSGSEALKDIDFNLKMDLVNRLSNNASIRKVMDLAGKLSLIARNKQKTKTKYARSEVVGVDIGNSIQDATLFEKALLSDPDLEDIFWAKFAEGKLMVKDMQGKDTEGQGPVVVAIDHSGSMKGDRDEWAKAVAIAMYNIAVSKNRKFIAFFFNYSPHTPLRLNGKGDPSQFISWISKKPSGGTSFEAAIKKALDEVEEEKDKADILFITDGDDVVADSEEINKRKAKLDCSLYSVIVRETNYEPETPWADGRWKIDVTTGEVEEVYDRIFGV